MVLAVTLLVTAACGDGDGGIDIDGAWARTSPTMTDSGAVYMQIRSGDGDRLIGAAVDPSVAGRVEIHETVTADGGQGATQGSGDDEMGEGMGPMMMQEIGEIPLPPGETVALEPGGLHLMLLGLPAPLELGETFEVTLRFAAADDLTFEVEVRDQAP
jgi:copper(I)-binding protein